MSTRQKKAIKVFDTERRIRLGIWGLGRGLGFQATCRFLNIDVVAGCDYNEHMRRRFLEQIPGAFVTADADEFLKQDFDAVLLATFFPNHAGDAIRCMRAGKHVLSEVASFFTMADGVQLVEEVEKSGLVYNQAENYPFTAANMYLARRWKEGLFGELMYAEYEYVHECRSLCYTYIDGVPVKPGNTVHKWRSWLNFHYYCTHSLGPVMVITGTRPTRVVALPGRQHLAGYLVVPPPKGKGGITPSLVNMSNGGIIRNLMGETTNDTHVQRIWGTLGAAEFNSGGPLRLRLGASGGSPKMEVIPKWDSLGELAANTGHGGGDFWTLYYFARQILTGEKAPFDLYSACDVTIPGILAYRSSLEGGKPYDVPDFRIKSEREKYRRDHWHQEAYDCKQGVFPGVGDYSLTRHFTQTMKDIIHYATLYRAYADWSKVVKDIATPGEVVAMCDGLVQNFEAMRQTYAMARKLADACPQSDGARVLREMLAIGCEDVVMKPGFLAVLKRELAGILPLASKKQLQMIYPAELLSRTPNPKLPPEYQLRQYQPEDEKAYFALMAKAGFKNWTRETLESALKKVLPEGFFVIVHQPTQKIVATAMATHNPGPEMPFGGELGWVAGDPEHAGHGLGQAVCAAVVHRFAQAGYRNVYLLTDDFRLPAIKVYLKLGFKPFIRLPDMEARWRKICSALKWPYEPVKNLVG